jgi:uncharacterized protein (UPF0335 family)
MRLRDEIRPQVEQLANLMMWANSQRSSLANQSSVYGHCEKALRDIIVMEFGQAVYNAIDNSRNGWNFGGNGSFIEDVEAAIENAQEELQEEIERVKELLEEQKTATNTDLHEVKKPPVLKSRRFAKVIDNELHVRKYEDPSHGWLAVPMQWLEELGIVGKISDYSYLRGSTAYLEEDDDMAEFYGAAKRAGFTIFIDYHHTDNSSPVRSYPRFPQTEGAK